MAGENPQGKPEGTEELVRIVKIKPGSAAEKSLKFELPGSLNGATVNDVLKFATTSGKTRSDERLVERINVEMQGTYGVVVNETPVKGDERLDQYFVERTLQDGETKYLEAEIVVAAKQEGGIGIESYVR